MPLYLVWAVELYAAPGVEPLEWIVLTTLPIEDFEDAGWILDIYATRWVIERFHYVLKQGLRVERLQFDNFTQLDKCNQTWILVGSKLWDRRRAKALRQRRAREPRRFLVMQSEQAILTKSVEFCLII